MTDKQKAAHESSPKSSHGNSTAHLQELPPLIIAYLQNMNCGWPFASAQEFIKGLGFTRTEAVDAINTLCDGGVIRFHRRSHHNTQPFARVSLELVLVEQGGAV